MDSNSLIYRVKARRKQLCYTVDEYQLIKSIHRKTQIGNIDNVSRTQSYLKLYKQYPEMEWAFLASMVSRNAGWNMTDLKSESIYSLLSNDYLKILFHTYERPNWLIFDDAYPQLLIYVSSVKWGRPLFHLLKAFDVSLFMEMEWEKFWETRDHRRLVYALIINEQHVIHRPVIQHGYYANKVFEQILFKIEETFRLNAVVFPDLYGFLYGFSVTNFRDVDSRIDLGKRLYTLLFHVQESEQIRAFGLEIKHTGARFDYEQFHQPNMASNKISLRELFPIIKHRRLGIKDWFNGEWLNQWFETPVLKDYDLTQWYRNKRKRISKLGRMLQLVIKP